MRRKVVIETIAGPQTIEGLTVSAVRKLLDRAPDDSVLVFMFETTPTVRQQMNLVDMMIMPAHAVYGGDNSEVCCIVGPEIENAKFEDQYRSLPPEPPPVDRTNVCTTDGQPLDQRPETDSPDGQHKNYKVLCEDERAMGFVRPYRDAYRHLKCGHITVMGRSLAETYARDPGFYGRTFCQHCKGHFPVGAEGEFTWYEMDGTEGPKVGT